MPKKMTKKALAKRDKRRVYRVKTSEGEGWKDDLVSEHKRIEFRPAYI